jgi:hypothetical protein
MKNTSLTLLVVALIASFCHGFAPAIPSAGSSATCLNLFGKIDNAYLRGGKPSWEFENDTMYVEDPKAKTNKPTSPTTKTPPKKVTKPPKKIFSF